MSVVVIRTNKLCANCLYLPAEDLSGHDERLTAIEGNDLCSDCALNGDLMAVGVDVNKDVRDRVTANSPWIKANYKPISPPIGGTILGRDSGSNIGPMVISVPPGWVLSINDVGLLDWVRAP